MIRSRSLLFLFLFSLLGFLARGQSKPVEPADWFRFEPENQAFSIETPTVLQREGIEAPRGYRKYFGKSSDAYLYVFSENLKNPVYVTTVFSFLKSAGQPKPEIEDPGVPTKLTFIDQFGYWHRITMFRTKNRIYLAQALSKVKDDPIAIRFDDSFAERKGVIEEREDDRSVEKRGVGTGDIKLVSPGAYKNSPKREGGIGPGPVAKPAPDQTSPLKIISKPRPGYTDFARLYSISGSVIVRATFLAAGTMGEVTPVTGLPFGLTEQAVDAARRVTFEPAYRNGQALTIVRPIEYTFTIY